MKAEETDPTNENETPESEAEAVDAEVIDETIEAE